LTKPLCSFAWSNDPLYPTDFIGPVPLFIGPGGTKASLVTWLKSNELADITTSTDGSEVTDWQDHWTGNHDFSTSPGNGPTFRNNDTDNINYNPVIDFDQTSADRLSTGNNNDFNNQTVYTNKSFNIVFRTPATFSGKQVIFEQGGNIRGINIYLDGSTLKISAYNQPSDGVGSPWNSAATPITSTLNTNTVYLVSFELEGDGSGSNLGNARAFLNGEPLSIPGDLTSAIGLLYRHTGGINLGYTDGTLFDDGTTTSGNSFDGDIAEFVYCNEPTSFSASDRNKIESYLAIKYGLTLSQNPTQTNYVNSAGTIIFNTNLSTSLGGFEDYDANIAGIGRDDESELEQVQSRSIETGSAVTIDAGGSISSDNTFLIWGNDQGAIDEINSDKPSNIIYRIEREWRVNEIGELGNTAISFDISSMPFSLTGATPSSGDFSLLIANNSSNGDFSGAQVITGGVLSASTVTFNNINLDAGEFFTLGTGINPTFPGGVTGIDLWLKANDGALNSGDATDVTSWEDRSGSGYNLSDVGTNEYIYRSTGLNFNPTIDNDDGTNRRLANGTSIDLQTVYLVTIPNSPDEFDNPFSENGSDDEGIRANAVNGWRVNGDASDFAVHPSGSLWFNGIAVTTDPTHNNEANIFTAQAAASTSLTGGLEIGDSESNRFWHGDIAEILAYNDTHTSLEKNRIESYLALKYGITLDQSSPMSYVDSNGDDIWNATTNASYNHDIAGIGRDDESAFEQKQSKSVNPGSLLTVGHVSIAASNALNPNSFASDRIWLSWGNDAGSTAQGSSETTDVPTTVTERMTRIWKVEKSGAIDDVSISFDLSSLGYSSDASEFCLLVDDNDTDMTDATIIPGGSFDGDVLTFQQINLTDGYRISLGTERDISFGPGGKVTNLTTWLKANDASNVTTSTDGANVTLWEDALLGSYDFSTGTSAPTYNDNEGESMNFNQNIEFDASGSSSLTTANNNDYNVVSSDPFLRKEIQMAFRTSSDITTRQVLYEQGGGVRGINIYIRDGQLHISAWNRAESAPLGDWNSSGDVNSVSTSIATNQSYIVTFQMDGDDNSDGNGIANGTVTLYLNGNSIGSLTGIGVLYEHIGLIGLGYSQNDTFFDNGVFSGTGEYFTGEIAEFIYCNEPPSFSSSQRNQTESYLAVKYGITLDQTTATDYTNSGGTIIWSATTNSAYNNDIAGIGRDDVSILNQPKSKSANQDAIVTIEATSGITGDNQWLIWGNDGEELEGTIDDGNTDFNISEGINSRLFREWKVQENTDIGSLLISFDLTNISGLTGTGTNNLSELRLMVDTDGTFSSGADYYSPVSVNPVTNIVSFAVNLSDGEFFTLGSEENYALPVEFLSFDAVSNQETIILNWVTSTETNNSFFTIEKSSDGLSYQAMGYLDGAGNSTSQTSYQYTDLYPNEGLNYYRVKQTDFNGQFSYTDIKSVFYEPSITTRLYPNPVEPGQKVHIQSSLINADSVSVWITNPQGQKEMLYPEIIKNHIEVIIPSSFKNGIYIMQLVDEKGQRQFQKILVK
jgi:hypothetical protein